MEVEEGVAKGDTIMAQSDQTADVPSKTEEPKSTYKSFKKKYRKMRIKFDEDMRKSNELYLFEQQANATVKRLAQMNSQILDILLDVNSSPHVPSDKRINLSSAHASITPLPPFISISPTASDATPQEQTLQTTIKTALAARTEKADAISSSASKSLSNLLNTTPHPSSTNSTHLPADLLADLHPPPLRYLTMDQIESYLDDLDNTGNSSHAQNSASTSQEIQLKNPHSVYNWLRVHEPKVFLQDGEAASEKSSSTKPGALRGAGKRGSTAGGHGTPSTSAARGEHLESVEDDGAGLDAMSGLEATPATGKGKNKRKRGADDEDSGYHPKQGRVEDGKGKKPRKPRAKKGEMENAGTVTPTAKRSRKSTGKAGPGAVGADAGEAGVVVKEEDAPVET